MGGVNGLFLTQIHVSYPSFFHPHSALRKTYGANARPTWPQNSFQLTFKKSKMPFDHIHKFNEINQFHHVAQGDIRSKHDDVHVFNFKDLGKNVIKEMPLFRTNFYQIGLMKKANFKMSVYEQDYELDHMFALIFFKPGQLIKFSSDPDWEGYVIHFKTHFLNIQADNEAAMKRFTVLDPTKESFLMIPEVEFNDLAEVYEKMIYEYEKPILTSLTVLELYLQILFQKVNDIYFKFQNKTEAFSGRKEYISFRYKQLVNEKLRETKTISDYADLLFVTPKYLIEAMGSTTGVSPKKYIDQKIISETKTLLRFTEHSIYDIAVRYQFKNQAHFSNFFKLHTGYSPNEYRKTHS